MAAFFIGVDASFSIFLIFTWHCHVIFSPGHKLEKQMPPHTSKGKFFTPPTV
jgi:hypothetical protein